MTPISTWRELFQEVERTAAERGDHVWDLPVNVGLADDQHFGNQLIYCEPEPATEEDAAEKEALILGTNWD